MALGIAAQAVDDAWEYSQTRSQFGKRICSHQSIRHMLADVQTKLSAARLMLLSRLLAGRQRHASGRRELDGEDVCLRDGPRHRADLPEGDGRLWLRQGASTWSATCATCC